MNHNAHAALFIMTLLLLPVFSQANDTSSDSLNEEQIQAQSQALAEAQAIWDSLERQTGEISLKNGMATLSVSDQFYYLNPKDAETVLVDVWGNLAGAGTDSLGMLFPERSTPFDQDAWAVTINYEGDGYVSDEDAKDINYNDILNQLKADTKADNNYRIQQGLDTIELVGWASTPYYDAETRKLHWAQEYKFGNLESNTLNYNIRVLGRQGVLILNFIAGIDQKSMIEARLDEVLSMAEFSPGNGYEDFNPDVDQVATYGIGALVAGKVIAKTGFFALALVFIKKFGVFILLAIGGLLTKLFNRKKSA